MLIALVAHPSGLCEFSPDPNKRRAAWGRVRGNITTIRTWALRILPKTPSLQRYDIVDNRDIADAMKKLEDSEKGQISHVLVTFGDSAKSPRSNPTNPQVH
jgi:hypothetical protein